MVEGLIGQLARQRRSKAIQLAVAARDISARWFEVCELLLRGTVESRAPPTWN